MRASLSFVTPMLRAGAMAIATVLTAVVQAGPFGFDMGDSMPEGEIIVGPDTAAPYVEIKRPLDKWTTIWVYGDDESGVAAIKGNRDGSHVDATCEDVAEIYGEPDFPTDKLKRQVGKSTCGGGLGALWVFEPPEENGVAGIIISYSKDHDTTVLDFIFENNKSFVDRVQKTLREDQKRAQRTLREDQKGADSLY